MRKLETDVIVVGTGVAGMTAALSALEGGAKTISVERATAEDSGGNSRWTDANILIETDSDSFEPSNHFWLTTAGASKFHLSPKMEGEAAGDYEQWSPNLKTAPFLDPEVLGAFAENIPTTLKWLVDNGVQIDTAPHSFPYHVPVPGIPQIYGGGLAVLETLTPRIAELGGEFLYETTATALMLDDMGKICGLRCTAKNNEPVEISAKSVILACGGFQGNPQMLAQYCGQNAKHYRPVASGGYYNKGEGLQMALDVNAAPAGDWSDVHRQMVDPRSPQPEALTHIWPCGIVVNQNGQRFMDEFDSNFTNWLEEPGKRIIEQPRGISYIIYDEQLNNAPNQAWRLGLRTEVPPIKADTLAELAALLMIPPAALEATVTDYNKACVNSDDVVYGTMNIQSHTIAGMTVDTMSFDGLGTQGVVPPKSNGAKRLDQGPFYCYPMIASICFTLGGLRVNSNSQVLNYSAEVIPGLYAAGETIGLYYGIYASATSVLRGLTFGKIAGSHAAKAH